MRGMQKHVEIDEPEETQELDVDPLTFGVAPPIEAAAEEDDLATDALDADGDIGEAEDEAALAEELAEDDLADEIDLADAPARDTEEEPDLVDTPPTDRTADFDEEA
ncbi:MAG: hypothetical protein ACREET_10635 [Stellaceae bacterium]